jgi:hypothetical protein
MKQVGHCMQVPCGPGMLGCGRVKHPSATLHALSVACKLGALGMRTIDHDDVSHAGCNTSSLMHVHLTAGSC